MSSSNAPIDLHNIWKKYSKRDSFHRSFRDDLVSMFSLRSSEQELHQDEFWALQDINLQVARGECLCLFGANGSGKSTLLKLVANITAPTRGEVHVRGRVAPLIELGAGFHPDLTGRQNIYMNGAILGMRIPELKALTPKIIAFAELDDFMEVPVKKYSSGMALRLAFAVAIHSRADIFLFDEIISVGDAPFRAKCLDQIRQLKKNGKTILFVSHNPELANRIADRTVWLDRGKILPPDSPIPPTAS